MKRFFATAAILAAATAVQAQLVDIETRLVPIKTGATTNDLVTPDPFDVWEIVATNNNAGAATSVEIDLAGDFLGFGDTTFKAGSENPVIFGFEAPDSFFVLPAGTDPADVLAVNTTDSSTQLATSYTVAGGADLIPGGGAETTIATISLPAGTAFELPMVYGRAAIGGVFTDIVGIPEPTSVLLAGLAMVGFVARRR